MPAPIKGMACSNCVYYEKTAENFGECRRYAPHSNSSVFVAKADAVGVYKTDVHFPKVYDSTWCGQFAARKPDQVPADIPKEDAVHSQPVAPPPGTGNEPKLKLTPEEPAF